jgi:small redox-active disulfide protein 2
MQVKVLGAGCANCHRLEDRANQALRELGADGTVELVTDFSQIAGYGVMGIPALVVDDRVVMTGRVPGVDEIVSLLEDAAAARA